ncbi:extracellular solute-binding protein [Cohnella hashimotonis]|uniref:Extracellular solute-binding protein n=1 Tax=Cohnella hashimotonis TaxID=2826895 RepID=A0ABT6TNZ7_9BACL|nr:extracellular solute-binding protein [Cohnella hashimotonis]MDI4648568.1 extracellular solute-binding protein [Cohnella hashimotonis]
MRKKWALGSMAVMMAFGVAACSKSSDNSENKQSSSAASSGPAQTASSDSSGSSPITYTFGRNIDPNSEPIKLLESQTGETLADNRWTRLFKEKLNVSVDYKMVTASPTYDQQFKLAMASNDLPDMFNVTSEADMKQLMDAGALEDLTDAYKQYGSELLKSIIEAETARVFEPVTKDGRIYAIPLKMPSTNGYNHLWIREDWLTKLGLERPKTMDDVYKIAKAFKEGDPDGNGKPDTFGLQIDNAFRNNMKGFFWGYGADPSPDMWVERDGKAVRGFVQPEMKEPLAMLQTMYKEGIIDKEFGTKDNAKSMESVVSGKTGMFYGPHWSAFTIDKTIQNDPNAKWIVVPLPSKDGSPTKVSLTIGKDSYVAVKKGTKNPENLVKMFNVYVEALFGKDAEFSKYYGENGVENIWQMSPIYTLDPMIDLKAHQDIKAAIANGTTDSLGGTAAGFYANIKSGMWTFEMMFGPKDTPFAYVDQSYPDQIVWNAYLGAPTPTQITRGSSMDELIVTTLTAIIMGKTDADQGFDKMVAEWNKLGGDKVTQEVNAELGK